MADREQTMKDLTPLELAAELHFLGIDIKIGEANGPESYDLSIDGGLIPDLTYDQMVEEMRSELQRALGKR